MVAAFGSGVAPADKQGKRERHGGSQSKRGDYSARLYSPVWLTQFVSCLIYPEGGYGELDDLFNGVDRFFLLFLLKIKTSTGGSTRSLFC